VLISRNFGNGGFGRDIICLAAPTPDASPLSNSPLGIRSRWFPPTSPFHSPLWGEGEMMLQLLESRKLGDVPVKTHGRPPVILTYACKRLPKRQGAPGRVVCNDRHISSLHSSASGGATHVGRGISPCRCPPIIRLGIHAKPSTWGSADAITS
jgi:hypothetical protein